MTERPLEDLELDKSLRDPRAGGIVSFSGVVRNHNDGHKVCGLEYEAYTELAEKEAARILDEAHARFELMALQIRHRTGYLEVGDMAVWVGALAAHRDTAFKACRYVIDALKERLPIWKKEHYVSGPAHWVNCQGCHDHNLQFCEMDLYDRQTRLAVVGDKGQKTLANSRVLVVGAGGLGVPALMNLAGSGVGALTVCDGDRLEASNLPRQPLYNADDVGGLKAKLAVKKLSEYNPFITIHSVTEAITFDNAPSILTGHDVVVDGTDNLSTKFLIHDVCRNLQIPLVQASVYQLEGELQVFTHAQGQACLRCLWPSVPAQDCVGNCAEAGVLGPVPSMLGALQAMETVKLLLGQFSKAQKEKLIFDLSSWDFQTIEMPVNPECPLCQYNEHFSREAYNNTPAVRKWEIEPQNPWQLQGYEWIDIRSEKERQRLSVWEQNLRHIPSTNLNAFTDLDPGQSYILMCSRGVRSRELVEKLRQQNYSNFYSLKGGRDNLKDLS